MSDVALCKCGIDMAEHDDVNAHGLVTDHDFDAAGTRHRCGEAVNGYLCPRPRYHDESNVPCGPLTGKKLW